MVATQTLIFIQVKTDHICERKSLFPMSTDQFRIERKRRATRCEPQNCRLPSPGTAFQQSLNFISEGAAKFINFAY